MPGEAAEFATNVCICRQAPFAEAGELGDDHPVASAAIHELQSRRTLYLALLLHDVAKGRGGDHSAIGAQIALKTARRMGLTEWECETASWLVRNHLIMSLQWPGMPQNLALDTMQLLAEEVFPKVRQGLT